MKKKLILTLSLVMMLATAGIAMAAGNGQMQRNNTGDQIRQEQCEDQGARPLNGTGQKLGKRFGNENGTGSCDGNGDRNRVCDGSCQS